MKKQPSNQLVCHISHTFWNIEQSAVRTCLEQYDGEWFKEEEQPKKHPIELVNEKYPNGWCVERCDEVVKDLNDYYHSDFSGVTNYYGTLDKDNPYASAKSWDTLITRTEYLSITRPQEVEPWQPTKGEQIEFSNDGFNWVKGRFFQKTILNTYLTLNDKSYKYIRPIQVEPTKKNLDIEEPKQRDWTGVRFKIKDKNDFFLLENGGFHFSDYVLYDNYRAITYTQETVDRLFSDGTWIELPAETEQPTIHAEKPNDLEAIIEALNNRIINLEKRLNII